jgi:REP element-mobilizing transposase RayT
MPRGPRLDAPGCLHHVMVRGIERRQIFNDDRDRCDLLDRLSRILPEAGMSCFAWTLMPNHVHLVLRTGPVPLARVMSRVSTGYALRFNRRHERVGHLFQGRYRSLLVEKESYLLALVRYVHLNPLRAGQVQTLAELGRHRWTGHAALLGNAAAPFQSVQMILEQFGETGAEARRRLVEWMRDGLDPALAAREQALAPETEWEGAPRGGGDDAAVLAVAAIDGRTRALHPLARAAQAKFDLSALVLRVCERRGVVVSELEAGVKCRPVTDARAEIVYRACTELELPGVTIATTLGLSKAAVSRARVRGRTLVEVESAERGRK